MSEQVLYELRHPGAVQYSHNGDMNTAQFIELKAPNYKQLQHFTPLKQGLMRAITGMQSTIDPATVEAAKKESVDHSKKDATEEGRELLSLMYGSDEDVHKFILRGVELFKSGTALMDGEVVIGQHMIDCMNPDDVEGMVGCYLAAFVAPSLMGGR